MGSDFEVASRMELKIDDMRSVTAQGLINELTHLFTRFTEKGCIHRHPSVFLRGQPGVGKSQAVQEIAKKLEETTNKKVVVTDIRLLMFNPVDLRGIPIADRESQSAVWLRPKIFDLDASESIVNILFLDELTSAPQSLQAAAYQIALDRKVGEHALSPNTFVIAAGNRSEDNAVTFVMPSALKNRFIHYNVIPDVDAWLDWARQTEINREIIAFIEKNPDMLSTDNFDRSKPIVVTPRSWEMLSVLLDTLEGSIKEHSQVVASVIGNNLTRLMLSPDKYELDVKSILNGERSECPKTLSQTQRATQILENKVGSFVEDETQVVNVLKFLLNLPIDYGLRVFRKILQCHVNTYDITSIQEYHTFIERLKEEDE